LDQVAEEVDKAARTIAASQFPAGRLVQLTVEVSRSQLPWTAKMLRYPLAWVMRSGRAAVQLVRWMKTEQPGDEVVDRRELERQRLQELAEQLTDRFRSLYPGEATPEGLLSTDRCRAAREGLLARELPAPQSQWEDLIRQRLVEWCSEHRWLSYTMAVSADVLQVAGLTAIVIDLGTTGGVLGTTIGLTALAGAGSGVAGVVINRFGKLKLDKVAEQTHALWQDQRRQELAAHLAHHFTATLFAGWRQSLESLDENTLARCRAACGELHSLAAQLGVRS
jgi:hypothetical protein